MCLSLIPLVWFFGKGGAIINGVDTNFPLDPAMWLYRRFYMWNNLSNGGSDFSFAPAGIFFHLVQFIPYVIGLSLQSVEKISLIFWFGLIIINSYLFASNFVKENKILKVLFVTLYALNIYMFNTWENVKVANLSLVAGIPLLLHIFISLKDNLISKSKALLLLVAVSFILSGAGINPAYFITAILTLFVFAFSTVITESKFKEVSKIFIFMTLIITVIGSYWIVPTISFVLRTVSQSSSIGSIGFNNWIDSLSENASIINVLRLQGAWDWYVFDSVSKEPLYLPYTPNYFFRAPFILFSFVVPAIALLSLVFVNKRKIKYYLPFLFMFLLGIFLGAGSHEPTGTFFRWLSEHLPYFSLFRSPWYIFTPILTLSLAGLTVLFFDRFKPTKILNSFVVLLIVSNAIYCYPLVTGRIFRPTKIDGFFVNFPNYVFETGKKLEELTENRILSYPDDQLEKFSWGYVGVEPLINLFSDNEMVFSSINNTESPFSRIVSRLYKGIKTNNYNIITNLSKKLNIDLILEKSDQQTLSDKITVSDRWKMKTYGEWIIHQITQTVSMNNKINTANNFYTSYGDDYNSATQLLYLSSNEHLITFNDTVVQNLDFLKSGSGKIISSRNSQFENYRLPNFKIFDPSYTIFNFYIPEDGFYRPVLEKRDVDISNGNIINMLNESRSEVVKWKIKNIDDANIYFESTYFIKGDYNYIYKTSKNLVYSDDFTNSQSGGEQNKYTDFGIPNLDYQNPYLITFDYNWSYGNEPSILVSQKNERTMLQTKKIDLARNYHLSNFGFYFMPVETKSSAYVSFLNKGEGNLTEYKNLKIYKLFTNNLVFIKESSPKGTLGDVKFEKISPVKYFGIVKEVKNPQTLIFTENYSDGWKIKVTDTNGNKIRYRADHFTVDLYANAWYIDTVNQDFKFEIYYDPQKYFNIGVFISLLSFVTIISFYVFHKNKNEK